MADTLTPVFTEIPSSRMPASEDAGSSPSSRSVPSWLLEPQDYTASKDRERFLQKNTLKLTSMLAHMKLQRGGLENPERLNVLDRSLAKVDCALRLLGLIATIICISVSTNMFFVYTALALFLLALAIKPGADIIDILKTPLVVTLFTAIIMLPAIFLGQPSSFIRVSLKVFLSVGLVISFSRSVAHNDLVAGLRFYHVPGLVILILDLTLSYIVMLGEVAGSALDALKLRSVGRNADKSESSSGVIGITFLKSRDFSAEMYEAMECRGFTGEFTVPRHRVFTMAGAFYLVGLLVEVAYLLALEGVL